MRRLALSTGGWLAVACVVGSSLWACSGGDGSPFSHGSRGGQTSTGGATTGGAGASGSSSGNTTGGSPSSGASGASGDATGGVMTGGTTTGGTTGDGGAAADSGTDSGGTTTGGVGGTSGSAGGGTTGGAGMSGAPMGGVGMGGAGMGGAGKSGGGIGGAGTSGSGGGPSDACKIDSDCSPNQYCKKTSCDAEEGVCTPRGHECRATDAAFAPVCGCDGITYYNTCVIEHEGFNVAMTGECISNRATCTRAGGPDSCPERLHAHCYRPVAMCGDISPTAGVCWVLPDECPTEPQTQRYCGGTAGLARCIGLCEVIDAENSFRRDAPQCAATTN